jgi:hypothetical protein
MFYFKFTATTPYCGTEYEEYHLFDEKPRIDDLEEMADEIARANAEQYEYLVTGWNDDNYDDEEERENRLLNGTMRIALALGKKFPQKNTKKIHKNT